MIKSINHISSLLILEHGNEVSVLYPANYSGIESFIQDDNVIYALLGTRSSSAVGPIRRRNVIKSDENSNIKWTVEDPLDVFKRTFSKAPEKLAKLLDRCEEFSFKYMWKVNWPCSIFDGPEDMTGRIALMDETGIRFILDTDTGNLRFWAMPENYF